MDIEHEQWVQGRVARQGFGSSDAASACGIPFFKDASPLALYIEKTMGKRRKATQEMRIGTRMEPVIAALYEEWVGVMIHGGDITFQHPTLDWVFATPDRWTFEEDVLVELKNTNSVWHTFPDGERRVVWGESGSDDIPDVYHVQVQHQMACRPRAERVDVACLIGGTDFRIYEIPRHQALIESILEIEAELWGRIQRREPPPADWTHPDTPRLMDLLHRPDPEVTVELDGAAWALVAEYEGYGKDISSYEKARKLAKGRLVEMMGNATIGLLPDGRRVSRKRIEVAAKQTDGYEYYDFRVLKPKQSKETS